MLLEKESISQRSLCRKSGMHPSKINRFLNEVGDINSSEFFQLLDLMSNDFQKRYWQLVIDREFSDNNRKLDAVELTELVKNLSPAEQISIMKAIIEEEEIFDCDQDKNDINQKLARNSA